MSISKNVKNVISIHFSESGTVLNKDQRTAIVSAIVVPADHRKEVKAAVNDAIEKGGIPHEKRIIKWTKVSPKEQHIYMNVLTALNRDEEVRFYGVKIRNFEFRKLMPAYVQVIQKVMEDFPGYQVRIFLPKQEKQPTSRMKALEKALEKTGIEANLNQVLYGESRFIQCADFIGGAILFFTRDDMYLEKIGTPGKASVVEHGLNLKKKPGKLNTFTFKEARYGKN